MSESANPVECSTITNNQSLMHHAING